MKITLTLTIILFSCIFCIAQRTCGTVYNQAYINSLPSDVQDKIRQFESEFEQTQKNSSLSISSTTTPINSTDFILIPVVVHVVWNTAEQNISDAQICSQIAALNEDYARLNVDAKDTPTAFVGVASKPRIQFYLATRDPNGNPTTGITRTNTATTQFKFSQDHNVKFTTMGGRDAWLSSKYLNLWVCNLYEDNGTEPLLGHSSVPANLSSKPAEDGAIIKLEGFRKEDPRLS